MIFRLLIILTVLTNHSFGQEIQKIVFTSQQDDEPPSKQGRRPKYIIVFLGQESGDFVASDYYEDKRKKKLKNKVTIGKERIEKIIDWKYINKKTFTQSDLDLNISTLKTQTANYKLNFALPPDLTVKIDSFQFCRTYDNVKTISIGGETFTITLLSKSGQNLEFIFDEDYYEDGFNLQEYIFCYKLLVDKIPDEIPSYGFFSKDKVTQVVLYYQRTVECEGFYYKEFTDKHPNMSAKDKRMMTGWNFIEYMGQRSKKK